jgi:hypothetical protein
MVLVNMNRAFSWSYMDEMIREIIHFDLVNNGLQMRRRSGDWQPLDGSQSPQPSFSI